MLYLLGSLLLLIIIVVIALIVFKMSFEMIYDRSLLGIILGILLLCFGVFIEYVFGHFLYICLTNFIDRNIPEKTTNGTITGLYYTPEHKETTTNYTQIDNVSVPQVNTYTVGPSYSATLKIPALNTEANTELNFDTYAELHNGMNVNIQYRNGVELHIDALTIHQ